MTPRKSSFFIILIFFSLLTVSHSKPRVGYVLAKKKFLALWHKTYPLKLDTNDVIANPKRKGVLCGLYKKRKICYYHFHIFLRQPLPPHHPVELGATKVEVHKQENYHKDTVDTVDKRQVEAWLADLRLKKTKIDEGRWKLYFLREDLLPARAKGWLRL